MKRKIIAIAIFISTAVVVGFYPFLQRTANANVTPGKHVALVKPKIQLAILLDTSGSMSGLINQTREQLWQVVNEFAKARRGNDNATLEVAVYEYGNSNLSANTGYIRQVSPLTSELDQVSEALFALTTSGGDEYCGYVIQTATNQLNWSKSDADIKAIFIAGNEPFTQGPVNYQNAIQAAKAKGITVNTIHAGNYQQGANSGWQHGATLAGGEYMSIDHNHKVAHYIAPQDKKIADLNAKLNDTYVPYGEKGQQKAARQLEQDKKSRDISLGLAAKRTQAKASAVYDNASWDLVDAIEQGRVDLESVEAEALPQELRKLDKQKQEAFLRRKADERKKIKEEIRLLGQARNAYVAEQQAASPAPAVGTIDKVMSEAIHKEAEKKHYTIK